MLAGKLLLGSASIGTDLFKSDDLFNLGPTEERIGWSVGPQLGFCEADGEAERVAVARGTHCGKFNTALN